MTQQPRNTADRTARLGRPQGRRRSFAVDVADRGREFLVSAELPGLRKQDFDVTVRKDKLRIVADYGEDEEGRYLRKERGRGTVRRVVRLPEPIDERHASASYSDGVLWVTLKKRRHPKRADVE